MSIGFRKIERNTREKIQRRAAKDSAKKWRRHKSDSNSLCALCWWCVMWIATELENNEKNAIVAVYRCYFFYLAKLSTLAFLQIKHKLSKKVLFTSTFDVFFFSVVVVVDFFYFVNYTVKVDDGGYIDIYGKNVPKKNKRKILN